MEKFQSTLLKVWQEAGRHIEISESVKCMADLLARDLPIGQIVVYRIVAEGHRIEVAACRDVASDSDVSWGTREVSADGMNALMAWWKRGKVARGMSGRALKMILPADLKREILAGPIGNKECSGMLLLVAVTGRQFTDRHRELADALRDPFSAALENDRQLHDLALLREAAEADKRSLLARLGRDRIGDVIVGADSGLRDVMERVKLVARSSAPVLIIGETGSGKELIARAIHHRSVRSSSAFVRVNCGAIPPELIDSQLFGHERGAFTGAVERRRGWFERADGGTLLLDEIAELSAAAQVRLLRVLQDGWLERVGGHDPVHVDVRIVAATHRDLAGMVTEGRFREDLWYRVAVFPIVLPPLRNRREDIPDLVRHFARRSAIHFGLLPAEPSKEDMEALVSYDWPGNVREVAAVLDRAVILGDGDGLEVSKALGVTGDLASVPGSREGHGPQITGPPDKVMSLDAAMRKHIETALAATRGRVEGPDGAAVLLQINPNTLRARMRKLKIDWRAFRSSL